MDKLFIGLDSGTQGTKAVIFSLNQKKILIETYATHKLTENNAGKKEQEPQWWIDACTTAIKQALEKSNQDAKQVCAIGVSGQQHGMVPLDKNGQVLHPAKLWCDTETDQQAKEITEKLGGNAAAVKLIGNSIAVGFTASKILWLKQNAPKLYEQLATVLLPHDYINFWLTGEKKAEFGDASGTAYFDVRNRQWSTKVLSAIDDSGKLESCLPQLIESDQPIGKISHAIADQFGFSPNVIVSSGGGDNMIAAIGTGNVAPGVITASLGTSGAIYCFSASPVVDPQGELAAFCSSDGNWLPLVCTMNVTVSTELTRALFNLDIKTLNDKIAQTNIGADGIILLPYFNGERTPALPNARATISGISSTNYKQENICRAAMEGATFGLRYGLDVMERNGITPREIRLVGGGAKSAIWRQMVANIFNSAVVCPITQEAGALGAALQAMWCYRRNEGEKIALKAITKEFVSLDESTRVEPNPSDAKQYAQIYLKYLCLNETLKKMNS